MRELIKKVLKFTKKLADDHVSAYASQSAFFLVLSLIPIILLMMTLVQYTPVTKADVLTVAYEVFPTSIRTTIISIINEVYNQSQAVIPLTAVIALWSAGRGTLAITNGLNCIYAQNETRNYVFLRIRSAIYTFFLILVAVLSLVFLGFGNTISLWVNQNVSVFGYITEFIIEIRTITMICVLIVFSLFLYCFLPNNKRKIKNQIAGAVFTSFGWTLASFIISVYMDIFKGFSNMYGSLTTIVLIMLWFYFCMYILLVGGEINVLLEERLDNEN